MSCVLFITKDSAARAVLSTAAAAPRARKNRKRATPQEYCHWGSQATPRRPGSASQLCRASWEQG